MEKSNPGLLFSHIITPVKLLSVGEPGIAVYRDAENQIRFKHLVIPDSLQINEGYYGHHMGVLIGSLSDEQADMLLNHQNLIQGFNEVKKAVDEIDFCSLNPYGNHLKSVVKRFERNNVRCWSSLINYKDDLKEQAAF
jgi:hypothetical protein